MNKETRIELMFHAFRWANNMIVEATSNHAVVLPAKERETIIDCVQALAKAMDALRAAALK